MENALLSVWVYGLIVVVVFPVFFIIRLAHLRIVHDVFMKYAWIDSLILWAYVVILLIINEHFGWIINRYCECKIDMDTYKVIYYSFILCSYLIMSGYFLIKRFFLKSHPKLINIYSFIWELLIFTVWTFFSGFLFIITIFLLSWE